MTVADPIAAAKAIAAGLFPHALWVWLTGSVLRDRRTAGSDLDTLVICGPGDCPVPYRESVHLHGFPVELFVNTPGGLGEYLAKDGRRPILHRMIAEAVVVAGDAQAAEQIAGRCRAMLAAGAPPLSPAEVDRARSCLTDAADDLRHATDPAEIACLKADMWRDTAILLLGLQRHWTGGGKWLARELKHCDPEFAQRWLAAQHDPAPLAAKVLEMAGGPLWAGYRETRDETMANR